MVVPVDGIMTGNPLQDAKNALREAVMLPSLRPDLFQGLRAPPRGLLLFGPPGTGKTLLVRTLHAHGRVVVVALSSATAHAKLCVLHCTCLVQLAEALTFVVVCSHAGQGSGYRKQVPFLQHQRLHTHVKVGGPGDHPDTVHVPSARLRAWASV
jgi:hypothetical protein